MLSNVKSIYICKIIFSYVNPMKKLNLIKYNKNLQNINELSLIDYKIISGKFITFENNGKGQIYNSYNNSLIFEGEFMNKKRNGKGKEYNYNLLLFEGEYKNGKRHGKGKEY